MNESLLRELFDGFNSLTALVIGDVMIDSYVWGKVNRISPEAPVPIVQITKKENRLGGAANVALNVAALGAKPIICAVVGNDANAEVFTSILKDSNMHTGGVFKSDDRPTTVKTRVISSQQHIVRIDEESLKPLNSSEEDLFIERVKKIIDEQKPNVIIFEDYNKGVLTEKVIKELVDLANALKIPTTVDPKKDNFFTYRNVTLFKPNLKELSEGLKVDIDKYHMPSLEAAVAKLEEKLQNKISLITLSELGVYMKDNGGSHHIPAHVRNISDVSGAGDTVISVASLCLALNADYQLMAALANLAGGLVCEEVGVVPIDKAKLFEEAKKLKPSANR